MGRLRIAIVGTGGIAEGAHAPALQQSDDGMLWSAMSRDLARANEFAQRFGAKATEPAFDSLSELLGDPELDAVIITTPDKLHAEHATLALKAGKHVLLEKPMTTELESALALSELARKQKLTLAIGYHLRWHVGHKALIERVRQGELGELRHVRAQWSWNAGNTSNWRASDQLGRWWGLAGVGTHCLDLIRWTLLPTAGEIAEVRSLIAKAVFGGPHDETAALAFCFENGATAEFCSSVLFDAPSRFEIYGSRGFAVCEGTLGRHGAGSIRTHKGELNFKPVSPFIGLHSNFVRAVKTGQPPEVDGFEGAKNIEILLKTGS